MLPLQSSVRYIHARLAMFWAIPALGLGRLNQNRTQRPRDRRCDEFHLGALCGTGDPNGPGLPKGPGTARIPNSTWNLATQSELGAAYSELTSISGRRYGRAFASPEDKRGKNKVPKHYVMIDEPVPAEPYTAPFQKNPF